MVGTLFLRSRGDSHIIFHGFLENTIGAPPPMYGTAGAAGGVLAPAKAFRARDPEKIFNKFAAVVLYPPPHREAQKVLCSIPTYCSRKF